MIRRAARPETHYTIIRNDVLRDKRLSYRARGVLASILSRPDNWSIRADQLALEGGEGRGAVRTALKELRECGYLKTIVYKNDKGQFVTEQVVFDTPQDDNALSEPESKNPNSDNRIPVDGNSVIRNSESWSPLEETLRTNVKKELQEAKVKNSPATVVADEKFDAFWKAFPKKKDKQDAYKAWVKATKRVSPDLLIEKAQEYAESRKDKEDQYTKYPATWLNKGSWENAPDQPVAPKGTAREAQVDRVQTALQRIGRTAQREITQ